MAKKKTKNINQMKEALLSNAGFIKSHEAEVHETTEDSLIEDDVLAKFEALANFEQSDVKVMINKALNHFLKLKGLQVEQALKAQNK